MLFTVCEHPLYAFFSLGIDFLPFRVYVLFRPLLPLDIPPIHDVSLLSENSLMMYIFLLAGSSHSPLDRICILYIQACLSCCMTAPYYLDTDNSRILHHIHTRTSYNILSLSLVFYMAHTFFVRFLISSCILPVLYILHPDIRFLFASHIYHSTPYTQKRKIRCHVRFPLHIRLPARIHSCRKTFDGNMQNIFPFPLMETAALRIRPADFYMFRFYILFQLSCFLIEIQFFPFI